VLSEGFMWRHNPQTDRLVSLLPELGELRFIRAAFSFVLDRPDDVRWDPELDGGALLDVGCYCVNAARLFAAGEPERVWAESVMTSRGVDSRFAAVMRFPGDVLAAFDCGFDLPARDELELVGAEGSLWVDDPWHCLAPAIEVRRDAGVETIEIEPVDSYLLELEDVSAVIRGRRDAPRLGRADAVGQARTLESLLQSALTPA
jgi:predicted dehydrogenase